MDTRLRQPLCPRPHCHSDKAQIYKAGGKQTESHNSIKEARSCTDWDLVSIGSLELPHYIRLSPLNNGSSEMRLSVRVYLQERRREKWICGQSSLHNRHVSARVIVMCCSHTNLRCEREIKV